MVLLRIVVVVLLSIGLAAQQRLWRILQPAAGPFGEQVAVIGDRDGDRHPDVVRAVYFLVPPLSGLWPHAWTFSGRTGQLLTMGPRGASLLFTAGDVDRDGCGDYVIPGTWAAPFPTCFPTNCTPLEARSGRDDRVLWHVDLPSANSFGSLAIGDLDLDGDGRPDVLVGTNQEANGILHAISGRGSVLYRITGQPGAGFGAGIGKFVDYDGDGCDDFVLGNYVAPYGAVDIRSGRDGSVLRRLPGPPSITRYGSTAAKIGDLDGDGVADVVVGDSGPFTPGVLVVLGSVSGAVLRRWQVNTVGFDDFGWPDIGVIDVDRDGFDDVIASSRSSAGNFGQFIFSGRDGSLIEHYDFPNEVVVGDVERLPPYAGDAFPRYACHSGTNTSTGMHLFSGAPDGVDRTGMGSAGTLPRMPILGLRELQPGGFRVTVSGAPPGALAVLVVGFRQASLPFFDLSGLGFPGSLVFAQPTAFVGYQAGSVWPDTGYTVHDFTSSLVAAGTPGAGAAFLQWIVLDPAAPGLTGGVSEAFRIHVR